MAFWEILTLGGTMATILGVFLTIYGIINNRTVKEESRATREILSRIEQGQKEQAQATRELLSRIDLGQNETRREVAEARKEASEARREMAEAIRYLADLVRQEGEKTRQAIRAS